ncbi:MAG: response regulator [Actinomycetota bacterium]|nr:response regulator [Actinomycetota bacterium]
MARLTVVNDDPALLDVMGEILRGDRYVITLIESIQDELLQRIRRSEPDLLMIDLRHGDDARRGWEIVRELWRTSGREHMPVVLCSADIPALSEVQPELEVAADVVTLELPFEIHEVLESIQTLLGRREASTCS